MAGMSDPHLARLLARRTKEPEPETVSTPDSLNLSFNMGLDDEESKQKIAYLSYESETLEDKNRELEGENQRLRLLLRQRENDIFKLKNDMDELKMATAGGGLGSEKAIQRIVELSKKNRDLISQLECEKSSNKRLTNKLNNVNSQEVQRKLKSAVKARKEETTTNGSPVKDTEKLLKEKVAMLTAKSTESSHQLGGLKQEMKLLTKVLQREVGEGTTVQSVLANPAGWRGRAEQIALLQSKLTNLKGEETAAPSRLERQRHKDIKLLENNRKQQLQELKREKEQLETEFSQSKKNYDAVKARNSTLSGEIRTLRTQLAALAEKGRNDDNLINQLLEEKGEGAWTPGDNQDRERREALQDQVEMLQMSVGQKERRIAQLEEEITRAREIQMRDVRPCTHPRSAPEGNTKQQPGFDVTYLLRATEVEKDRLFELTDVLNNRLSSLETEKAHSETQLKKTNRQLVEMEKLVENLKSKKVPRCDACNQPATLYLASAHESQLAVLQDEVSVLKSHVDAVTSERQQDLQKYKQLLEQSRQVFIAGLREVQRTK